MDKAGNFEPIWTYTWPEPDRPEDLQDFTCWIGGKRAGRVYPYAVGGGIVWKWFSWAPVVPNSGQEQSMRLAMMAVEER